MTEATPILIRGGILLSGPTLTPTRGAAVIVEGQRIARVAAEREIATGTRWRVIDADGHTVVPGLIDAHVHLFGS